MADGFSITSSDEWTEMHQRLTLFSDKVAKTATLSALKSTAALIKGTAKQKVQRSTEEHLLKVKGKYVKINPGNLEKEIRFRKIRDENTDPGVLRYQVYVRIRSAWYAKFVEYGRSNKAATPFMRPAFEQHAGELLTVFNKKVHQYISEGGF